MSESRPDRRALVDDVDALLQSVRADVVQLEREKDAALERAVVAERALEQRDEDEAARSRRRVAEVQQAIEGALAEARRAADEIIAEAQARADRLLANAEAEVRQMSAGNAPELSPGDGNLFADLRRSVARGDHLADPSPSADDAPPDPRLGPPPERSRRPVPVPARVMRLASLLARR